MNIPRFDFQSFTTTIETGQRLNTEKHHLECRDDQTAAQWLDLAARYQANLSRANAAYCLSMARKLGAVLPETSQGEAAYEYDWQVRNE